MRKGSVIKKTSREHSKLTDSLYILTTIDTSQGMLNNLHLCQFGELRDLRWDFTAEILTAEFQSAMEIAFHL